jgi:hypothetical protein
VSKHQYRNQIVERAADDAANGARGRVDVLQGRPKAFDKGDDSPSCKLGIRSGDDRDCTYRVFEPLGGQGGAAPAVGTGMEP